MFLTNSSGGEAGSEYEYGDHVCPKKSPLTNNTGNKILDRFALAWLILCVIYIIISYAIYLKKFKRYTVLQRRGQLMLFIFVIGTIEGHFPLFGSFIQGDGIPCFITQYFPFYLVSVVYGALVVKIAGYYFKVLRSYAIAKEQSFAIAAPKEAAIKNFLDEALSDKPESHVPEGLDNYLSDTDSRSISKNLSTKFKFLNMATSNIWIPLLVFTLRLIFIFLLFIWGLGRNGLLDLEFLTCVGCTIVPQSAEILLLVALLDLMLTIFFAYKFRNEPDPLGIVKETLPALIILFIGFVVSACLLYFDPKEGFSSGRADWIFTLSASLMLAYTYMIPIQLRMAHQGQLGHEGVLAQAETLENILKNDTAKNLFKLHLMNEFSFENLQFYDSATYWKMSFDHMTSEQKIRMAKNIEKLYIQPGAVLEINISSRVRNEVLGALKAGNLDANIFDNTIDEVFFLMAQDSFYRFLLSSRYLKWKRNDLSSNDFAADVSF